MPAVRRPAPPPEPAEPANVAVVGGGLAGLVAANRCAQLGLRTVLLEKGASPDGDSNARISTGLFHLAWRPLDAPGAELEAAMVAATDGDIAPGIARAIAANAAVALRWLIDEGISFAPSRDAAAFRWQVAPHGVNVGSAALGGITLGGHGHHLLWAVATGERAGAQVAGGRR
jgi:succinate dehydrogenase/fumarate reductase flavoprotein subunit